VRPLFLFPLCLFFSSSALSSLSLACNQSRALLTDRSVFTPGSQFVETAFVGEYPKLLRLFNDLLKRLRTHMEVKDPKDESRLAFEQQLIGALAKFEHQYLSRSLTHLFEPINHIFAPGRAAPVPDDVVRLHSCHSSINICFFYH